MDEPVEYLLEENRVLREQIGRRRMRFNDDQRRRLAVKARRLGRKLLARVVFNNSILLRLLVSVAPLSRVA